MPTPRPSRWNDGYCETPGCGNREGVFYDAATRKHSCHLCWASLAGTQSLVIPKVAAAPMLIHLDRYGAANVRLPRR